MPPPHPHEARGEPPRGQRSAYLAAAVPLVCVLHCLAVPLLVLFAPALAPSRTVETVLLLVTGAVTAGFLLWGFRVHRARRVWIPALVGYGLWGGAHAAGLHGAAEIALELVGALLVAAGLVWSTWLRHQASCIGRTAPARRDAADRGASPAAGSATRPV